MSRAARKALEQPRQDSPWLAFEHPAQEVDILGEAGVDRTQFLDLLRRRPASRFRLGVRRDLAKNQATPFRRRSGSTGRSCWAVSLAPKVPKAELQNGNRS